MSCSYCPKARSRAGPPQQAANYFALLDVDKDDQNYKPLEQMLRSEQARHQRYAAAKRAQ